MDPIDAADSVRYIPTPPNHTHMEGCFHSIVSGLKKGQIKEKNKDQKCFVVLCATIQTTEIGYTLVLKRSMYLKNR